MMYIYVQVDEKTVYMKKAHKQEKQINKEQNQTNKKPKDNINGCTW